MLKFIPTLTGYKATDANMKCRDHQFELDVWYEVEGDIVECQNGFHFCEQPSGVWSYYSDMDTRVFKVEAKDVLVAEFTAGTDYKRVARSIRLVKEVALKGDRNTGSSNTGNRNTGDSNTGDWNTGNWNTGNSNTGNSNTGSRNTGDSNTGNCNTGYCNTGDSNTGNWSTGNWNAGDCNTGYWNTGYWNTGDSNTGDRNTGNWNAGDRNTGYFNEGEPTAISFGEDSGLSHATYLRQYPEAYALGNALMQGNSIDFEPFKGIPGITPEKLSALHQAFVVARQSKAKKD